MTSSFLMPDIERDEGGCHTTAYQDSMGVWTIWVGHTPAHKGQTGTLQAGLLQFQADVSIATTMLNHALPWWRAADDLRQDALANMSFNLGITKLLGFGQFIHLMRYQLYTAAANDLRQNTLWYRQVGDRGKRIADQIETGIHQT